MKPRLCLLFFLLTVPVFAVDANKPRPGTYEASPLTDQINQNIWIDQMYAGFLREQCAWFEGEIMAYNTALAFVGQYGMRFTVDADFQVCEEQYMLRFITAAWLMQQYAKTPATFAYCSGAINGYYRVLDLMNQMGAYGGPVPGTVPATDDVVLPKATPERLESSDYDPINRQAAGRPLRRDIVRLD